MFPECRRCCGLHEVWDALSTLGLRHRSALDQLAEGLILLKCLGLPPRVTHEGSHLVVIRLLETANLRRYAAKILRPQSLTLVRCVLRRTVGRLIAVEQVFIRFVRRLLEQWLHIDFRLLGMRLGLVDPEITPELFLQLLPLSLPFLLAWIRSLLSFLHLRRIVREESLQVLARSLWFRQRLFVINWFIVVGPSLTSGIRDGIRSLLDLLGLFLDQTRSFFNLLSHFFLLWRQALQIIEDSIHYITC